MRRIHLNQNLIKSALLQGNNWQHVACDVIAYHVAKYWYDVYHVAKYCHDAYHLATKYCRLRPVDADSDKMDKAATIRAIWNVCSYIFGVEMEWSNEKTVIFIEDYRNNEILWNHYVRYFKNNSYANNVRFFTRLPKMR